MLLCSRLNLGFNLNYFSFFIEKFVHLFFTLHIFNFFYPKINQTYTITSMTFEVSKMGLTAFLAQLVSILHYRWVIE